MKTDKSGFTLMELMFAAAVLAIVLGGLLGVFVSNFRLIESGRNLTVASNHAQCVMEEIRNINLPATITAQDWTAWAQADPPGGGGCNTLNEESIQVSYPSGEEADPLEIVITVNWTEKGRARSVQLVTLLTER